MVTPVWSARVELNSVTPSTMANERGRRRARWSFMESKRFTLCGILLDPCSLSHRWMGVIILDSPELSIRGTRVRSTQVLNHGRASRFGSSQFSRVRFDEELFRAYHAG